MLLAGFAALVAMAVVMPCTGPVAHADLAAIPAVNTGKSPDALGTWTVHYERLDGGDRAITADINDHIDDEVNKLIQQATWDGSTRRPWTYDASGTVHLGPITASELFVTQYDTDEPRMPIRSVSSVVCDTRNGSPITWDTLLVDKQAGLARLGAEADASLTKLASPAAMRDWRRQGQFAPIDTNFRAWVPTPGGIELHFPQFQFGGGLKAVTVPWAALADQIKPEFSAIMGGLRGPA